MDDLPPRPAPPQSLGQRARTWLEWVGPWRVVGTAVVVLAVLAAAYWLVKPPPATTESKLPFAGSGASNPSTTVAVAATSTTGVADAILVHVAGAVHTPGVYRLATGARVLDAVAAAGGLDADADADVVNLAAVVHDGERVWVPRVGQTVPVVVTGGSGASGSAGTPAGPVNLNTATADELDALPGVGPATAAAIVAHRDQHGPFGSVDDLADVRGIGPAKLEALRGLVTV